MMNSTDNNDAAKREREELYDAGSDDDFTPSSTKEKKKARKGKSDEGELELDATGKVYAADLLPAPYFHYRNHSTELDEDPLTPVTQAGHVPCFPAKMHAILASPDFNDIVAWDDHGRSFRILKPKQFEMDILPLFFEHSKFSSFVRQANGWGFRRFLSGVNRNSYYQEYFLRSMPWLCKKMRRPKVGEKKPIKLEHEPDLRIISQEFPVPNNPMTRELEIVLETIRQGPRARMPVHWAGEPVPRASAARLAIQQNVETVKGNAEVEVVPNPQTEDQKVAAGPNSQVGNGQAAAVPNHQAVAQLNPFQMGLGGGVNFNATQAQNPMFGAPASANLNFLNYMQNMQNLQQSVPAATQGYAQDPGFAAGVRAANQYHKNKLANALARSGPVALAATSSNIPGQSSAAGLGMPVNANPQANAEYMRLLQMQIASQGNLGGLGGAGMNPVPVGRQARRGSGSLSLEQLQAFQAGLWHPSMSRQNNGR